MSARNLAAMSAAHPGFEGAMTALAAELESLPPATLSTKGLRLLLDESISVVSDRLNEGDNAASKLKDLLHVKADPVRTAPASGRDASAPAADASAPPGLPLPTPAAAAVSGAGLRLQLALFQQCLL